MKTAILITEGVKQIMFTPENESEKEALRYISPNDEIHTVVKKGTFYGGYYRAEKNEGSVMFVITPKTLDKRA